MIEPLPADGDRHVHQAGRSRNGCAAVVGRHRRRGRPAAQRQGIRRRARRAVQVIRSLWSAGPTVDFTGRYYQLVGASTHPAAAGNVEIWLGAYQSRMLRLTGRVADGWIPSSPACPPEALGAANSIIDDAATASGRSPAAVRPGLQHRAGFQRGATRRTGSHPGISVFLLYRAQSADVIERFAHEVVPAVRDRVDAERGQ